MLWPPHGERLGAIVLIVVLLVVPVLRQREERDSSLGPSRDASQRMTCATSLTRDPQARLSQKRSKRLARMYISVGTTSVHI